MLPLRVPLIMYLWLDTRRPLQAPSSTCCGSEVSFVTCIVVGKICTEKRMHLLVLSLKLLCSLSSITLFLSISVIDLYKNTASFRNTWTPSIYIFQCLCLVLLYCVTWTQPKLRSSKVGQGFVLYLLVRTKLFFFTLPGNHHSINIPPKYKVLMSACLLRLTLISPKVLEQGEKNTDGRVEKRAACIPIQRMW